MSSALSPEAFVIVMLVGAVFWIVVIGVPTALYFRWDTDSWSEAWRAMKEWKPAARPTPPESGGAKADD